MAIRIIRGIHSISGEAAIILAGTTPIAIFAKAQWTKFTSGEPVSKEYIQDEWTRRWNNSQDAKGTKRLIPNIEIRLRPKHDELDEVTTSFLTGYRSFGNWLKLLNRAKDDKRKDCGLPHNARHLQFHCPK